MQLINSIKLIAQFPKGDSSSLNNKTKTSAKN